jgi:hypothetical protein
MPRVRSVQIIPEDDASVAWVHKMLTDLSIRSATFETDDAEAQAMLDLFVKYGKRDGFKVKRSERGGTLYMSVQAATDAPKRTRKSATRPPTVEVEVGIDPENSYWLHNLVHAYSAPILLKEHGSGYELYTVLTQTPLRFMDYIRRSAEEAGLLVEWRGEPPYMMDLVGVAGRRGRREPIPFVEASSDEREAWEAMKKSPRFPKANPR